jgi:hypothetical protein
MNAKIAKQKIIEVLGNINYWTYPTAVFECGWIRGMDK